ncbi:MAG: hypothetical protein SOX69_00245 [Oscillospiraceae bacterium]|mgnify:FL=1|nr:hypothetical protein [Oscillospiraceae bacterium]
MVSWFLKMFLKALKPFAKIGIILAIIKAIEEQLKGGNNEDPSDPAVPEA